MSAHRTKLTIRDVGRATNSEWDAVWRECPSATYFHSREWAEVWREATHGQLAPHPTWLKFSDGQRALLPFSVSAPPIAWLGQAVSSPAGTYGGWLSSSPLSAEHQALIVRRLLAKFGNIQWRMNPYESEAVVVPVSTQPDSTSLLELTPGYEALKRNFSKGHRAALKQAQREGVEIVLATSHSDWRAYYAAYQDSLVRWGERATSCYEWDVFNALFYRRSGAVRLWLAKCEGRLAAGALCLYSKNTAVYWHGAAIAEFFPKRPVTLLVAAAIEHACQHGHQYFDFNPSGGHEGVAAFKKGFGTRSVSAPMIVHSTATARTTARIVGAVRAVVDRARQ